MAEVRKGVDWPWRAKFAGTVWPATVVVPDVLRKHRTRVPFTENQQTVGEFGSDSAYEPFGETVHQRAPRGSHDYADVHIGKDRIERCGELACPISDEKPEFGGAIAEVHQQVACLLSGPRPSGFVVAPSRCTYRLPASSTKNA
ncbi:hypothetical protein SAMN05216215_103316 [Saccharopolyspora shandongensis]|uniref:Uncharacterized protein n=1 Tax=Saccharopolyspora shandongensis TaxID=418495 RepID=A0A1H3M2P6_9PSEU|nr:hypothetical protein SAMN05216215_103316 [Saccharopolyspora shandongensis]